jgi:predicted nucleotidyltransferase component of viral defense system
MERPLEKRLRKRAHVQTALLQDELADLVYSVEESAVLHGGTAIWRCYNGNRFSEDLDFYAPAKKLDGLPEKARERRIEVRKFKKTENLLFARLTNGEAAVRLEVNFTARKKGIATQFEKVDGSVMQVLSLSPEDLILEKIAAYRSRRLVRDVYDVFHLSSFVKEDEKVKRTVVELLDGLPKPVDEDNLKAIVYSGAIPSFNQLREALERRWK